MATPSYISTNTVLNKIRKRIRNQMGADLSDVVIFDGDLADAVEQRASASLKSKNGFAFVFFGFSEEDPRNLSGAGHPLRDNLEIDFFVIVRAQGKTRLTRDREWLNDLSDTLKWAVFEKANDDCDLYGASGIQQAIYAGRSRVITTPEVLSHLVRFTIIPRRG